MNSGEGRDSLFAYTGLKCKLQQSVPTVADGQEQSPIVAEGQEQSPTIDEGQEQSPSCSVSGQHSRQPGPA